MTLNLLADIFIHQKLWGRCDRKGLFGGVIPLIITAKTLFAVTHMTLNLDSIKILMLLRPSGFGQ
jgi:hypothetical protein